MNENQLDFEQQETQARSAREEAVARVGNNADPQWMKEALISVISCARTRPFFTTDDVWYLLEFTDSPVLKVMEPRAMGAVMRKAQKLGICYPTDGYRPSRRAECHARPVRVWQRGPKA